MSPEGFAGGVVLCVPSVLPEKSGGVIWLPFASVGGVGGLPFAVPVVLSVVPDGGVMP